MLEKNDDQMEDLAAIQKAIDISAGTVALYTKAERERIVKSTPEDVRLLEEAAARCTAKIKRKVLKKHARKARVERCCFERGKQKTKRKPLTELQVKGHLTEDREEWQQELQRHFVEVYIDKEETKEFQQNRFDYFTRKGDQYFAEGRRIAEISVDPVLQGWTGMSDNKVNGQMTRS